MSCASSGGSSKKSTAAQRAVETREYDVSSKDLMQSTIGAFQDLGFTIDTPSISCIPLCLTSPRQRSVVLT